jgi:hypothetical protein
MFGRASTGWTRIRRRYGCWRFAAIATSTLVAFALLGSGSARAYFFKSAAPIVCDGIDDYADNASFVCSLPEDAKNRIAEAEPTDGVASNVMPSQHPAPPSVFGHEPLAHTDSRMDLRRARSAIAPRSSGNSPEAH